MWVSFANYGDPNKNLGGKSCPIFPLTNTHKFDQHSCLITVESEHWPVYTLDDPQNFVFEQNITSHAESDLFRAEGMKYISDMIVARAGTNCTSLVACGSSNLGGEMYLD
jgi:triacylglycerol lipase